MQARTGAHYTHIHPISTQLSTHPPKSPQSTIAIPPKICYLGYLASNSRVILDNLVQRFARPSNYIKTRRSAGTAILHVSSRRRDADDRRRFDV
ncbi:hypothetical protein GGR51DRAFT_537927 [Nemania sp. FL0031]|nr:hypothetical protein GGR51DRAFT_537927 [Nemania sp. FL0031]